MKARTRILFMCAAMAACAGRIPAGAAEPPGSAFDRFAALMKTAAYYSMRVDSHEEMGDRSEDLTYDYGHSPVGARILISDGRGTGVRITTVLGNPEMVDVRAGPIFGLPLKRMRAENPSVTSLRGNQIAQAGFGALLACFTAHRTMLAEVRGAPIDGHPTTAIVFEHHGASCPNEPRNDRAVTADVLYVASDSGVPLLRKRFVGREIVERSRFRDFSIEAGPRA